MEQYYRRKPEARRISEVVVPTPKFNKEKERNRNQEGREGGLSFKID